MNTTDPVIHDEACIRALARQEAYDLRWSARCEICFGSGGVYLSFDPSAGIKGISLARGQMEDFDTCVCVNAGRCPRCAKQLLGPKWRPLNVRIWLAAKVERLAGQLRSLEMDILFQSVYWRASALFREDPTFYTWAAYHVADQIWARLSNRRGGRGQRIVSALWRLQAWIEHGYESTETPCWHCGWNWNSPGDAREPRECECWVANFEAEQDQVQDWLEQERMHRDTIADDDGGATHLLVGLPGGPIPVRRLNWHFRGPEEAAGPLGDGEQTSFLAANRVALAASEMQTEPDEAAVAADAARVLLAHLQGTEEQIADALRKLKGTLAGDDATGA